MIKKNDQLINSNLLNFQIPNIISNFNNNLALQSIRNKRKQNWNILNHLLKK